MKRNILSAIISLLLLTVSGQTNEPISIGKWRTHLAYNSISQIAQSSRNVYAVSDGALFSINKDDPEDLQYYSKMNGLNDTGIEKIEFDKLNNQLLIIYQNGNIDVMSSTGINNIPDLRDKQLNSTKGINDVYFQGNYAYLSCDFGIMVINMAKKEIAETYIIGPNGTEIKILSTTIHNNKIYALSEDMVYSADADNPNLVNFEYWKSLPGLPGSGPFRKMFGFGGKLLLLRNGELYKQEGNIWSRLLPSINISSINVSENKIIAGNGTDIFYCLNSSFEPKEETLLNSGDLEYDRENNKYWLAGGPLGIISFQPQNGASPIISYHKPQGPAVNIPWSMTFAGEKLFMVNGGRWGSQYNREGQIMIYEKGRWTNINGGQIRSITGYLVLDFMNVAVHPDDDSHFFVTSFGTGLYEFKNNEFFKWHNHTNTNGVLETIIEDNPFRYIRLGSAIFDKDKNLFLYNTSKNSIKILLSENNTWHSMNFPEPYEKGTLGDILISNKNPRHKWLLSVRSIPGILVWEDNEVLTDPKNPKNTFLSNFDDPDNLGSKLSPNFFYCIAQDKNGTVWVGTDIGPLLFHNPEKAFDPDYTCSRVKIPRNDGTNLADYLLKEERVKAIAIDGANRKWIGTENSGLYLVSENGQETIHHFTVTNSPLLSNNIMSLAINPVTGEVFIGTSNGLISFQSDAAEANKIFNNVYAYPNPVRENYNGIITITGLVENTQVKITDINGNLIYQTISNGSLATWNGKDVHGKKVNTGIYLAICANEDGTQSTITKIMVIN